MGACLCQMLLRSGMERSAEARVLVPWESRPFQGSLFSLPRFSCRTEFSGDQPTIKTPLWRAEGSDSPTNQPGCPPQPQPPAFTHTQGFLEQCHRVILSHGIRAPDVMKEHRSLFLAGGVISIARPSQAGRNGSCAMSVTKADLFLSGTVGEAPNQAGVISPPLP